MRKIDTMSKDEIAAELVRIASYCLATHRLDEPEARKPGKTQHDSLIQGMAIGRRRVCASIYNDLTQTFGIKV